MPWEASPSGRKSSRCTASCCSYCCNTPPWRLMVSSYANSIDAALRITYAVVLLMAVGTLGPHFFLQGQPGTLCPAGRLAALCLAHPRPDGIGRPWRCRDGRVERRCHSAGPVRAVGARFVGRFRDPDDRRAQFVPAWIVRGHKVSSPTSGRRASDGFAAWCSWSIRIAARRVSASS